MVELAWLESGKPARTNAQGSAFGRCYPLPRESGNLCTHILFLSVYQVFIVNLLKHVRELQQRVGFISDMPNGSDIN